MKMIRALVLPALIWGLSSAAAVAADRDKVVAFMQVTGFDASIASLRTNAKNAPAMLGLDADDFGVSWTNLADEIFEPEALKSEAVDILERTLDDDALAHAAAFYASDLGQRLVAVENESHFAEDDAKKAVGQAAAAELMARNSPQIGYFKDMADAIGSIDNSIAMFREVQVRLLMSAMASGLIENQLSEEDLRGILAVQDDEVRVEIMENIIVNNAFTYRGFSDDEMRQYRDALRTPQMGEVYALMDAVHYTLMADRYEKIAARMIELHPSQAL